MLIYIEKKKETCGSNEHWTRHVFAKVNGSQYWIYSIDRCKITVKISYDIKTISNNEIIVY